MDTNLREPTDEEIFKVLNDYPIPNGHKEIGKCILNISVDEYYSLFHDIGAPYNFDRYFKYRGYGKIVIT